MSTSHYVIGVDIGTTSTKAVLFNPEGVEIRKQAVEYPLLTPTPTTAEQDPDEIFAAVVRSIRLLVQETGVQPSEILCVSFSAVMHSLIAVNAEGKPLTKSITWADNRSAAWAQKIRQEHQGHAIYCRTGTPIHPMSPLPKLMWLRYEQPDLFGQAVRFLSIKEYVFYRLFAEYVVDYSVASATGLLNLEQLAWDQEALELAGISADQLSTLVPTTHVLRGMRPEFAAEMGLAVETPVVMGASDGVLANLGVGAIAPGVVAVTIGTSGAVRAVLDRPRTDPQERLFCYALTEQHWVIGGAVNSGGIVLRWVRDHLMGPEVSTAHLLGQDPYTILTAIATRVPPGAEGLLFHPYLAGERSPLWDANARGSFFGLRLHHTKAHFVRAALEGVIYNLYLVLQGLENAIGGVKSIQATGGFARSELWRQILADVFNRDVIVPKTYESSCLGAAVLGLYALQHLPTLDHVSQMIGEIHRHRPIPQNVERYQKILPLYSRLLEQFKPEYAELAQIQAALAEL